MAAMTVPKSVHSYRADNSDCNTCNDNNNNGCGDSNGGVTSVAIPCTTIVHAGQEIVYTVVVTNDGDCGD